MRVEEKLLCAIDSGNHDTVVAVIEANESYIKEMIARHQQNHTDQAWERALSEKLNSKYYHQAAEIVKTNRAALVVSARQEGVHSQRNGDPSLWGISRDQQVHRHLLTGNRDTPRPPPERRTWGRGRDLNVHAGLFGDNRPEYPQQTSTQEWERVRNLEEQTNLPVKRAAHHRTPRNGH